MSIRHAAGELLPWSNLRSVADIDADIRDELEFHLAMCTEENVRAGMSADEARRDAESRFGDFEARRRECQKIVLGPRLLMQRLQLALLALLATIVIYQAVVLTQMRAQSSDRIETLTRTIQQLQQSASHESVESRHTMPYMHWSPDFVGPESIQVMPDAEVLAHWNNNQDALATPWCDWQDVAIDAEGL